MVDPKPHTFRSDAYLEFIRQHSCMICGAPSPSDPHHVGLGRRGMGMKAPDSQYIPLCRSHHELAHQGLLAQMAGIERTIIGLLTEYIEKGGKRV